MNLFYKICILLIIVGGINWGLVGLFDFNAVAWLFGGGQSMFARHRVHAGGCGGALRHSQPVHKGRRLGIAHRPGSSPSLPQTPLQAVACSGVFFSITYNAPRRRTGFTSNAFYAIIR